MSDDSVQVDEVSGETSIIVDGMIFKGSFLEIAAEYSERIVELEDGTNITDIPEKNRNSALEVEIDHITKIGRALVLSWDTSVPKFIPSPTYRQALSIAGACIDFITRGDYRDYADTVIRCGLNSIGPDRNRPSVTEPHKVLELAASLMEDEIERFKDNICDNVSKKEEATQQEVENIFNYAMQEWREVE